MAEYIVPMKFTVTGDAYVTAESPEEAVAKAERGRWDHYDITLGGTTDWSVEGDAEPNE